MKIGKVKRFISNTRQLIWLHRNQFFVKYKWLIFVDILEAKALFLLYVLFLNQKGFHCFFLFAAEWYLYFSSHVLVLHYYFFFYSLALQSLFGYGKNRYKVIFLVLLSFASP